ncbi:hypothetical protein Tco_0265307 [Tanacetum coccineum]
MSEPNNENNTPSDNVRGETFEEHDIYMNRLLKSLNTADKNGIAEYPFISIEKHVERYPMYDETTHWRLRKTKVGEKYISVAQFKECRTYYALANGFSLWYEMSGKVRVVSKCGQRPLRLSDPEKGKQRKHTKYPSASSDDLPTCSLRCYARLQKYLVKRLGLTKIADLVMKRYKCKVSPNQCTNAKKYAMTEYEKTVGEHYAMFYVCFAGLADGWKAWCRKIIALEGCFLKSPNQCEILTAIGRDGNNHIYPVGLIEVVKDVMPNAEHRQCARHIYCGKLEGDKPSLLEALEMEALVDAMDIDSG